MNDPRNYKQLYQETLTLCENREHDIKKLQKENANLREELEEIKAGIQHLIDDALRWI